MFFLFFEVELVVKLYSLDIFKNHRKLTENETLGYMCTHLILFSHSCPFLFMLVILPISQLPPLPFVSTFGTSHALNRVL